MKFFHEEKSKIYIKSNLSFFSFPLPSLFFYLVIYWGWGSWEPEDLSSDSNL